MRLKIINSFESFLSTNLKKNCLFCLCNNRKQCPNTIQILLTYHDLATNTIQFSKLPHTFEKQHTVKIFVVAALFMFSEKIEKNSENKLQKKCS